MEWRLPNPANHALYVFPLVLAKGVDRARFAENLKRSGVEVGCGYGRNLKLAAQKGEIRDGAALAAIGIILNI